MVPYSGTSTVTCYIESATGIAEGGRTGLTAVFTGICMLLSLFLYPLVKIVGGWICDYADSRALSDYRSGTHRCRWVDAQERQPD